MQFKNILKYLREGRNLSQKQVAEACGISATCICQLETGARNPTGSTLYLLADFFQCSVDYLLGREDDFGVISVKEEKGALSEEEKTLIRDYRALAPALQEMLRSTIQTWKGSQANSTSYGAERRRR